MEKQTITSEDVGTLVLDEHKSPHVGPTQSTESFCAHCQKKTAHTSSLDKNHEILVECDTCHRHYKLPMVGSAEELKKLMDLHEADNTGQVLAADAQAAREAKEAEFLKLFSK